MDGWGGCCAGRAMEGHGSVAESHRGGERARPYVPPLALTAISENGRKGDVGGSYLVVTVYVVRAAISLPTKEKL